MLAIGWLDWVVWEKTVLIQKDLSKGSIPSNY